MPGAPDRPPHSTAVADIRRTADAIAGASDSLAVRTQISEAIEDIVRHADDLGDPAQAAIAKATLTLLAASNAAMQAIGVCQQEEPFADLYVVLDDSGRVCYCCTHTTQHCST
jgi:hypothetical protein